MKTRTETQLALSAGARYFPGSTADLLGDLPVARCNEAPSAAIQRVALPPWASDLGIGDPASLAVPEHCLNRGEAPPWERCDWWLALYEYLTHAPEWRIEQRSGPLQSYGSRLPESLEEMLDHAWVNRILLFLRRWCAQRKGIDESTVFGPIPEARIELTHDVDGVSKTPAIRFKQSAFCGFNALRAARRGHWSRCHTHVDRLFRFGLASADYWQFPAVQALEERWGQRSTFNFYGGPGGWRRGLRRSLLDPAYDVTKPDLTAQVRKLIAGGWKLGLHQSFDAWRDADSMRSEKRRLEQAAGVPVSSCRQHWLRFSLEHTWHAQEAAGLEFDMTFGFNDRPGFRGASALRAPAWLCSESRASTTLSTLPLVLMDSHLFDYGDMDIQQRRDSIDQVLGELKRVGGEASIVWHQRVFHPDYGWGDDYEYLLSRL